MKTSLLYTSTAIAFFSLSLIAKELPEAQIPKAEIAAAISAAKLEMEALTDERRIKYLVEHLEDPRLFTMILDEAVRLGPPATMAIRNVAISTQNKLGARSNALKFLEHTGNFGFLKMIDAKDPLLHREVTAYEEVHSQELISFQRSFVRLYVRAQTSKTRAQSFAELQAQFPALRYAIVEERTGQ